MRKSKAIRVGGLILGGGAPILIQSMCNTPTQDVSATVAQIRALEEAGCQIVRLAVPDREAARAIRAIKRQVKIPLVADIHFDYRLALEAVEAGVDKIRINPGNIGDRDKIRAVADACRGAGIPIRVGVNSGSIDADLRERYGVTPEALCRSALRNIAALEDCGFTDICVSLKMSDVFSTIRAYRRMAEECTYPLHLGVTEAGGEYMGTLRSAAAFGALLCDGIGDTIRVSLTADPVKEVRAARDILRALDLHTQGARIVSCPTCGRTQIDLIPLAEEAINADFCRYHRDGVIIRKGEILCKVPEDQLLPRLLAEIEEMTGETL